MNRGNSSANRQKTATSAIADFQGGNPGQQAILYRSNAARPCRPRSHIPNTRDQASGSLSMAKAIDLVAAADHATIIGKPLNVFVTIHFGAAKLRRDWRGQDAVSRFLRLGGQWLRTKGIENTFIWVLEHATGTGEHVHLLIHCPPWFLDEFVAKAEGSWMEKSGMLARAKAKSGIKIERVGLRNYHPTTHTSHDAYQRSLEGVLTYCLKAIDRDSIPTNDNRQVPIPLADGRALLVAHEHSNAIYGRRCSRSENISAKARSIYSAQLKAEPS